MTRDEIVATARRQGWVAWGKLHRYSHSNDSQYQCFRRRNTYLWIGSRFVERSDHDYAVDFVTDEHKAVLLISSATQPRSYYGRHHP